MGDYQYPEQLTEFVTAYQADLVIKSTDVLQLKPLTPLLKLKSSELETALALFFEVNAAFFSKSDKKKAEEDDWGFSLDEKTDTITGKEFYKQLSKNAAIVAGQGHPNAHAYPFSYFLTVIDTLNEANSGWIRSKNKNHRW